MDELVSNINDSSESEDGVILKHYKIIKKIYILEYKILFHILQIFFNYIFISIN